MPISRRQATIRLPPGSGLRQHGRAVPASLAASKGHFHDDARCHLSGDISSVAATPLGTTIFIGQLFLRRSDYRILTLQQLLSD